MALFTISCQDDDRGEPIKETNTEESLLDLNIKNYNINFGNMDSLLLNYDWVVTYRQINYPLGYIELIINDTIQKQNYIKVDVKSTVRKFYFLQGVNETKLTCTDDMIYSFVLLNQNKIEITGEYELMILERVN